jgi:hypothetical protein
LEYSPEAETLIINTINYFIGGYKNEFAKNDFNCLNINLTWKLY